MPRRKPQPLDYLPDDPFADDPFFKTTDPFSKTTDPFSNSNTGDPFILAEREQVDLYNGEEISSKDAWIQHHAEKKREKRERAKVRRRKQDHADDACIKVCWFVPKLPDSSTFRRWLPKHRHILFGHFGYWIFASFVTASSGTSLKTRCSDTEAVLTFVCLLLTSLLVSIPKFLSGDLKKMFGPTIVSFLIMFATALSLHQKPLICGFSNTSRRVSQRKQANMWGLVVSLQVLVMIVTMLLYAFWHLKHKDEQKMAALEGGDDSEAGDSCSDEDSLQGSPASVRWAAGAVDHDLESNNGL